MSATQPGMARKKEISKEEGITKKRRVFNEGKRSLCTKSPI